MPRLSEQGTASTLAATVIAGQETLPVRLGETAVQVFAIQAADAIRAAFGEAGVASLNPATQISGSDGVRVGLQDDRLDLALADGSTLAFPMTVAASVSGNQQSLVGADNFALPLGDALTDLDVRDGSRLVVGLLDLVTRSVVAADAPAIALLEAALAGVLEPWNVADNPTGLTGRQPWTRVVGTKLGVQGGQAVVSGDTSGEGLQVARCDTDIASVDQEIRLWFHLDRADGAIASVGVLARMDSPAGSTFYQFRAVQWTAGGFFDVWRNVAGTWTRIAGPISQVPPSVGELRLRVLGPGPVNITAQLISPDGQTALLIGPIQDNAGILTGTFGGLCAEWQGGTQLVAAMDDWAGLPIATPALQLPVAESLRAAVIEAVANAAVLRITDQWAVRLGESPVPTFFPIAGADTARVALGEVAGAPSVFVPVSEALRVRLTDAGVGGPIQPGDPLPVGLIEGSVLGQFVLLAEALALRVAEAGTLLEFDRKATADVVAIQLVEASPPTVATTQRITLVQVTGETQAGSGPISEAVLGPGPVAEQVGVAGPTVEQTEEVTN